MSSDAISVVWPAQLPPLQKLLLIGLADNSGPDTAPPLLAGVLRLAKWCGLTELEVVQIADELQRAGWLDDDYAVVLPEYAPAPPQPVAYTKRVLPDQLRQEVFERDGHRCRHCGTRERLSVDHIVAEVLGGSDDMENLQTLCRPCNSRKGTRDHVPPPSPAREQLPPGKGGVRLAPEFAALLDRAERELFE